MSAIHDTPDAFRCRFSQLIIIYALFFAFADAIIYDITLMADIELFAIIA